MGKIRSTLDIILEKTKDIKMSPEELKDWKKSENLKKGEILVRKYINGDVDTDDILDEVDNDDLLKDNVISKLIENVSLFNDNEKIFSAIAILENKDLCCEKDQIYLLCCDYKKKRDEIVFKIEKKLRDKFERMGISGSALIPNVEDSKEGKEALNNLYDTYKNKNSEILKAIHSSYTSSVSP